MGHQLPTNPILQSTRENSPKTNSGASNRGNARSKDRSFASRVALVIINLRFFRTSKSGAIAKSLQGQKFRCARLLGSPVGI